MTPPRDERESATGKTYIKPQLTAWGKLADVTKGGTGMDRKDGPGNAPKTKFGN